MNSLRLACLALSLAAVGPLLSAGSLGDVFEQGTVSLNARLRYEGVRSVAGAQSHG